MASRDEVERRLEELLGRLRGTEEAHVRIRAASDDLVALVDGEMTFVSAYLSGRIRVDAGVADMLQIRRML